jgi:hypothetical protein
MEYGKYKGSLLSDVPEDYILWIIKGREKELQEFKEELERREAAAQANEDWVQKTVRTGYKALMQQHHPDRGGSAADAAALNAAYEKLKEMFF